ncbi:MAG: TetR family transcriptional regulator [Rhodospirillales bacterium]|nr:TetR family transcriptional regulator [Rhodospirillales bacterium]
MSRTPGSSGVKTMQEIREVGLRLIYEHGFAAMNLRQLAAEVGIQVGSLYNHIRNKQDLLFELIRTHMEGLLDACDTEINNTNDPLLQLEAFVRFHLTYHLQRRLDVFVANFELRSLEPLNYAAIVDMRRAYESVLIEILERGAAARVFSVPDARVAAFAILSMLTGVCTWYRPEGRLKESELVAIHYRMLLTGLTIPPLDTVPSSLPAGGLGVGA